MFLHYKLWPETFKYSTSCMYQETDICGVLGRIVWSLLKDAAILSQLVGIGAPKSISNTFSGAAVSPESKLQALLWRGGPFEEELAKPTRVGAGEDVGGGGGGGRGRDTDGRTGFPVVWCLLASWAHSHRPTKKTQEPSRVGISIPFLLQEDGDRRLLLIFRAALSELWLRVGWKPAPHASWKSLRADGSDTLANVYHKLRLQSENRSIPDAAANLFTRSCLSIAYPTHIGTLISWVWFTDNMD